MDVDLNVLEEKKVNFQLIFLNRHLHSSYKKFYNFLI
jgi:hypothetical protein